MLVYTCKFLHYDKHIQVCFGLDMHMYVIKKKAGIGNNLPGIISIIEIIIKKMNGNIYDKRRSSSKVNFLVLIVYKVSV